MINEAEILLFELFKFYNVFNNNELSEKINVPAGTISKWKQRNSVNAIKKKCRELGIYNEIFGDINTNNFQNSKNVVGQDFSSNNKSSHTQNIGSVINIDPNVLKLVDTLYGFAASKDKVDELKTDLSSLLPKYM
ncbi:MAG: hypothetical protein WC279_02715 [Sulfurimonas sp.]|jgi:hypothetical protein|uniref:hypothetical protein n=1 Tax=Sulfurimonas sp. TaxID=2022749 RepID=UPI003569B25D